MGKKKKKEEQKSDQIWSQILQIFLVDWALNYRASNAEYNIYIFNYSTNRKKKNKIRKSNPYGDFKERRMGGGGFHLYCKERLLKNVLFIHFYFFLVWKQKVVCGGPGPNKIFSKDTAEVSILQMEPFLFIYFHFLCVNCEIMCGATRQRGQFSFDSLLRFVSHAMSIPCHLVYGFMHLHSFVIHLIPRTLFYYYCYY